ncbi:MAG: bifunctional folylpolyglutamate synthase/dihydrofolate synthase [Zetaproteobacteria bacterium]|nr:MAG: bifunctional folylpolyglutamate synthase/dihydrofolate synthase [Zetaproteobacteria bacterium]
MPAARPTAPLAPRDTTPERLLETLGAPAADRDYRPGHARMAALLDAVAPRRPRLRIRVAGTNGKGSTAAMVAAGLRACGLRVGIYTSPHLHRFHERIRIDDTEVDDDALLQTLARLIPTARRVGASYFETATAAALSLFSQARVDAEVLEAGVGARLDATTAVEAEMALLTPVALDHQAWLGDTLREIAEEKAAAGDGCRWFCSAEQPPEAADLLRARHPRIRFVDADPTLTPAMEGAHQQQNASLAMAALDLLHREGWIAGDRERMRQTICSVRLPGRLERRTLRGATLWLDVAHNPHAVAALIDALPEPVDAALIYTRADRSLADQATLLRRRCATLIGADAAVWDRRIATPEQALKAALADGARRLLLLGSFTSVAAARRWLTAQSRKGQ